MPQKLDITGQKFERLTVLREVGRNMSGKVLWECLCECGKTKVTHTGNLRNGQAKSCGCYNREFNAIIHSTHGLSSSPEYGNWRAMINRCTNPNGHDYELYMGRGISVCDRWRTSFEAFYADMGLKPSPHHSIERKDNSRGYSPDNCKWGTPKEQRLNQRSKKNKSGYTGICWHVRTRKWQVSIGVDRKQIHVGYFITKEEAIAARKQAEVKYHNKSS